MAFPTINGTPTPTLTFDGSAGTAHVINQPPTLISGDLILAIFGICQTATALSVGGGFTEKHESANSVRIGVFAKISDGTEDGGTFTITSTGATAGMAEVYRIDAGTWDGDLANVFVSTGASGTSLNPNPDSLAPGLGALDFLWLTACVLMNDGSVTAAPASYTNLTDQLINDTANDDATMGTARRSVNGASEDPGTFTANINRPWRAITIGVAPFSGAGEPSPDGSWLLEGTDNYYLLEGLTDHYLLEGFGYKGARRRIQQTTIRM